MSKCGCSVQEVQGAGLICPCRYDGLTQNDMDPHLEELFGLVVWLMTCGRSELKVFDSVTYPQMEGFKFHHEASGRSSCVSEYLAAIGIVSRQGYTSLPWLFVMKQTLGMCQ